MTYEKPEITGEENAPLQDKPPKDNILLRLENQKKATELSLKNSTVLTFETFLPESKDYREALFRVDGLHLNSPEKKDTCVLAVQDYPDTFKKNVKMLFYNDSRFLLVASSLPLFFDEIGEKDGLTYYSNGNSFAAFTDKKTGTIPILRLIEILERLNEPFTEGYGLEIAKHESPVVIYNTKNWRKAIHPNERLYFEPKEDGPNAYESPFSPVKWFRLQDAQRETEEKNEKM